MELKYFGNEKKRGIWVFELVNGTPTGRGWKWNSAKGWIVRDGNKIFQKSADNSEYVEILDVCAFLKKIERKKRGDQSNELAY